MKADHFVEAMPETYPDFVNGVSLDCRKALVMARSAMLHLEDSPDYGSAAGAPLVDAGMLLDEVMAQLERIQGKLGESTRAFHRIEPMGV
jgi:hypothetical protein